MCESHNLTPILRKLDFAAGSLFRLASYYPSFFFPAYP